ncbi:MAG: type IV pilus secretin PilQ [Xanthomonadaceae bacterium]|nr:type IV pilus secretin PilQ [Xanthomonadaceae bacterium]
MSVATRISRIDQSAARSGWQGRLQNLLWSTLLLLAGSGTALADNAIEAIEFSGLSGNRVQIVMRMSQPPQDPMSFTIDNPARIALDFPATTSKLDRRSQDIGVGAAKSITAVEAQGRTRVVVNLVEMVSYETRVVDNQVVLTLQDVGAGSVAAAPASTAPAPSPVTAGKPAAASGATISNVDFRRGDQGEGRVVVTLSDPSISVDMRQEGGKVVLDFMNSSLPERLERRLDVIDFATPVKTVDTMARGRNVRMTIDPIGEYEHLAYQTDDTFTVEIKPTTKEELESRRREEFGYTGERLSLNFQDIEARSVLQLLADFTGLNIVVSDTVTGNLTLRLRNVPWDQALDIVLKTKGLAMRQTGNVMLVAPSEEISAREKLELESQKQIKELAPLYSEFVQVNYAKASEISALLKGEAAGLTSERGSVVVDERTNTLLIQDTAQKLEEIRRLVTRLDIPVRQVLIESRIVIANDDFSKDLGVRFGATAARNRSDQGIIGLSGSSTGTDSMVGDAVTNIRDTGQPFPINLPELSDRTIVDLPVTPAAGQIAMAFLGSSYLLDLELTAMQAEGKGEVISSPRLITSNQQTAVIRQGVEIPYQEASSSGATSVSFKEAALSLEVTPQITPDDRVIMDVKVNKDSVGQVFNNVPSINTRAVETQVLVDNGETLVLGGIYEQTTLNEVDKVPFFGDLPGVGWMFRTKRAMDNKAELLIFVTPRIVKDTLDKFTER